MKINLGSGAKKLEGFVNLDIDPNTYPDYLVDLEKDVLPFPNNSVEEVAAHHIFEHLGAGYFHCLKELYRVCVNKAKINITVPDPRHDCFLHDPTHKRPITVRGLELFSKKFNNTCIICGYSDSTLGLFYDIDFEVVNSKFIFDKDYRGLISCGDKEHISTIIKEKNNIVELIEIELRVCK